MKSALLLPDNLEVLQSFSSYLLGSGLRYEKLKLASGGSIRDAVQPIKAGVKLTLEYLDLPDLVTTPFLTFSYHQVSYKDHSFWKYPRFQLIRLPNPIGHI